MEREQPEERTSESNHEDHMTLHQYLLSKGKPIIHHCSPSEVLRRSKRNRQCPEINKLIGGWKRFSIAQKLVKGDVVVYHLVGDCRSKVYIVRATSLGEVDGALGLLNLENHPSGRHSGGGGEGIKGTDMKGDSAIVLNDAEGSGKSISFVNFQSFNIIANNLILDSELPKYVRLKYYDLCCAQKSYLHVGLLKSISCALASGITSETVKIADAIKSCKILTPQEDFALWDKTLEGFELLGMEVGFLRAQLNKLVKLAMRSRKIQESKRYKQARIEHYFVTEEVETLGKKLKEKHQVRMRLNIKMKALNMHMHRHELRFQEEAHVPW